MTIDIDELCERVIERCGYRDGGPVVEAIRFTVRADQREAEYKSNSEWYIRNVKEAEGDR